MRLLLMSAGVRPGTAGMCAVTEAMMDVFDEDELVVCGNYPNVPSENHELFDVSRVHYLTRSPRWHYRGMRYIDSIRWLGLGGVVERAVHLARDTDRESILVIFPDELYLVIGWLVHKRTGLPMYVWYHNLFVENRRRLKRVFARWLQDSVFRDAEKVFAISDGVRDHLRRQHRNGVEIVTMPHFAHVPASRSSTASWTPPPVGGTRRIAIAGSLSTASLDATRRLAAAVGLLGKAELHVFTGTSGRELRAADIAGPHVKIMPFLSQAEFLAVLGTYDLGLVALGLTGGLPDAEFKTMFPTRTVDMMVAGIPLLAHAPHDSFFARYLRERDCAVVYSEPDVAGLAKAIERLLADQERCERLIENAWQAAQCFDKHRVKQQMLGEMGRPG